MSIEQEREDFVQTMSRFDAMAERALERNRGNGLSAIVELMHALTAVPDPATGETIAEIPAYWIATLAVGAHLSRIRHAKALRGE